MMKTIGFAWGPDFKPGYKLDTLEIVDIYQIMAFLLKIPPNMHDGSWDRYSDKEKQRSLIDSYSTNALVISLSLLTIVIEEL